MLKIMFRFTFLMAATICVLITKACSGDSNEQTKCGDPGSSIKDPLKGRWISHQALIKVHFIDGRLDAFYDGEKVDYPAGEYQIIDEEFGELRLDNGVVESFLYRVDEESRLVLVFRSGQLQMEKRRIVNVAKHGFLRWLEMRKLANEQ